MAGWICELSYSKCWSLASSSSSSGKADRWDGSMVNNAGVSLEVRNSFLPVHETLDSTFTATMSINSRGVFLGCKYAAKQMITQDPYPSGDRGWIINIGSVAGLVGLVGAVSYSASKGAVVQMTRTVALDLAHPLQRPVSRLLVDDCTSKEQELLITGPSHEDGHDKTIWWTMRRDKLNLQQCIPSKASASQKTLQRQPFFWRVKMRVGFLGLPCLLMVGFSMSFLVSIGQQAYASLGGYTAK